MNQLLIAVSLSLPSCVSLLYQPPDIARLENTILGQRRAIKSGHVILTSKIWSIKAEQRDLKHFRKTEIWFDGARIKMDATRFITSDPDLKKTRSREVRAYSDTEYIEWHEDNKQNHQVMVYARNKILEQNMKTVPDPRLLGLVPVTGANLGYFNLETLIATPNRKNLKVIKSVLSENDCWLISYTKTPNELSIEIWSSPQHGDCVVRTAVENHENLTKRSVSSDLAKVKTQSGDVWFPKRCVFHSYAKESLIEEEELDVEVIGLNNSIPPSAFTVESIQLPAGTAVFFVKDPQGQQEYKIWDGKKLAVPARYLDVSAPPPSTERRLNPLILTLGVMLLAIAIYCAAKYVKQQPVAS